MRKLESFFNRILHNKKLFALFIISVLVFALLIIVGVSFVFPKSIEGEWELIVNPDVQQSSGEAVGDSEPVYYVFEKPDKNGSGKWHKIYDGGIEYYNYEFVTEESHKKLNLGSVNLDYKITGSKLLGIARITLIYPEYTDENTGEIAEAEEYVLRQAKAPDYEKASYESYGVDLELVGKWISNERALDYYYTAIPYTQTVSINNDGIMTIHYESEAWGIDRYMYYAFTTEDSEITFSLVTDKDTEYTVAYKLDNNGNLKFVNDKTSDSVFADAFFGNFTYYPPENLPEMTVSSPDEG